MVGNERSGCVDVELHVRYSETDQMGHAYYANYLIWFEVGRTTYCRSRGVVYSRLEEEENIYLPVVQATCQYFRPLRYDRAFVVSTCLKELRSRALTFHYEIRSTDGRTLFAEGSTRHVFTDKKGKPRSLPREFRDRLNG